MKNNIFVSKIALVLIFLIAISCEKPSVEQPKKSLELPKYTETGANTFAWIINEKELVIANDNFPIDPHIAGGFDPKTGVFGVHGNRYEETYNANFYVSMENLLSIGKYTMNHTDNYFNYYLNDLSSNNANEDYYTDSLHTGELEITKLDTINRIVAGKFTCVLLQHSPNGVPLEATITLRGQFDYNYPKFD